MHEKELDIAGILNKESLVAGRHHVSSLLVRAVPDLYIIVVSLATVPAENQGTIVLVALKCATQNETFLSFSTIRPKPRMKAKKIL